MSSKNAHDILLMFVIIYACQPDVVYMVINWDEINGDSLWQ